MDENRGWNAARRRRLSTSRGDKYINPNEYAEWLRTVSSRGVRSLDDEWEVHYIRLDDMSKGKIPEGTPEHPTITWDLEWMKLRLVEAEIDRRKPHPLKKLLSKVAYAFLVLVVGGAFMGWRFGIWRNYPWGE